MQQEREKGSVQAGLAEAASDFEACARRAIEGLLRRSTMLGKSFVVRPEAAVPSLRCFVQGGNGDFSVVISLALERSDLAGLFPAEDEAMALDAIGELVNVAGGSFFSRPVFHSRFGCMRCSLPSFDAGGGPKGPSWNLRGDLIVQSTRLIVECRVFPKNTEERA